MFLVVRKAHSALRLLKLYIIWREKRIKGGDENVDKTFFVIRRPMATYNGIGADFLIFMGLLKYMERKYPEAIPVIDMEHYEQGISDDETGNAWEKYFEQPNNEGWTVEKIKRSQHIILANGLFERKGKFPTVTLRQGGQNNDLYEELDQAGWVKLFDKYIRLQPELQAAFEEEWLAFAGGKGEILGVKARGTDYAATAPHGHPIQPTAEQMFVKVDELLSAGQYSKIFLATEDEKIEEAFRQRYDDKIIAFQKRYAPYGGKTIVGSFSKDTVSKSEATYWYLKEMYFLSKCDAFISGYSSGVIYILLQNRNKFKETYIFNLGRYR